MQLLLLGPILAAAALLRLSGIDWDDYNHYHPDERYIAWVATTVEWPEEWRTPAKPGASRRGSEE